MKFDKFKDYKITSVKCNQPPGGRSKIALGAESNNYTSLNKKNQACSNIGVMYNIELLKELGINKEKKEQASIISKSHSTNKIILNNKPSNEDNEVFNLQHNKYSKPGNVVDYQKAFKPSSIATKKTSVKVTNAPGGKSKISLGFN